MTIEQLHNIISTNIKNRRRELNFSQAKLAELANISLSLMVDIENNRTWISANTLVSLCSALQIEVYELFKPATKVSQNETRTFDEKLKENAGEILRAQKEQLYKLIEKNFEQSIVKILESEPGYDK